MGVEEPWRRPSRRGGPGISRRRWEDRKHDARQRRSFTVLTPRRQRQCRWWPARRGPVRAVVGGADPAGGPAGVQQRALERQRRVDHVQRIHHRRRGRPDRSGDTVKISDSAITGALTTDEGSQDFTTTLAPNFQTTGSRDVPAGERHQLRVRAAERVLVAAREHPPLRADHDRHLLVRVPAHGSGCVGCPEHGQEQGQDLRPQGDEDDVRRRRRRRRGQGRAARDRRVPLEPEEVPAARRAHPQGRAAARAPRVRQDAARPRGRRRGQRAVLLHERVGVRRDVRGPGRRPRARAVPAGQGEGAGAGLPRRDRHDRQGSRGRERCRARRARRAGADPEPAARRDGRLRRLEGRHHHGRDEPPRRARPRARATRPVRPAGSRRPARPEGPRGDPARARPRRGALPQRRAAHDRRADARASPAPTSRTS